MLPDRLLHHRQPMWWQEVLFIGVCYWLYRRIRDLVPEQRSIAEGHGRGVQHLQDALHLNFERSLNRFVANHEPVAQVMNYYYATLHFVVTIGCLIWLFRAHPRIYRGARTVLFATSLIALAGFYLYPLAPPRLLPQYGYVDTLLKFHTWGSLADPNVAEHSNQYAAMPSLHIGWALWCGVSLYLCARRPWVRALGALYPITTLLVIVGTANHFIIDAVAGLAVLLIGCAVQYLISGRSAFVPAPIRRHLRVGVETEQHSRPAEPTLQPSGQAASPQLTKLAIADKSRDFSFGGGVARTLKMDGSRPSRRTHSPERDLATAIAQINEVVLSTVPTLTPSDKLRTKAGKVD